MKFRYGVFAALMAALSLSSCSDGGSGNSGHKVPLGGLCDGDIFRCEDGLYCVNMICSDKAGCLTDADCADTAKCSDYVCVPKQEVDCIYGVWSGTMCICDDHGLTDNAGICTLCEEGYHFENDACVEGEASVKDCRHGEWNGALCVCADGYKSGDDGVCSLCADGYKAEGEACVRDDSQPEPPKPQGDCKATFYYANAATHTEMGGEDDFDVYLVGEFNGWKPADPAYKMTYVGKGVHAIMIDVAENQTFKYKFYVDGWEDNAWQSDPVNPDRDVDGNAIATIRRCDLEFGDKNPPAKNCHYGEWNGTTCVCQIGYKSNDSGVCLDCAEGYELSDGVCKKTDTTPLPPPTGDCKATFSYSNQWTRVETGGAANFDVYLVGEFNGWETLDPAYKMKYVGNGVHSITIDVVEGTEYKYKFYVDGWDDNSWQEDPANELKDADRNALAKIDQCNKKFGSDKGFEPVEVDCVNGNYVGKVCECSTGYMLDEFGKCTVCADGYELDDQNKCVQIVIPEGKCPVTFTYTNQWTNKNSGGTADFDVYLVGSFNNWQKEDPAYKMTSDKNGTHSITFETEVGAEIAYKYYVAGWEENSWHADPANDKKDADGNSVANISRCGMKFGSSSSPEVNPKPTPDNPPVVTEQGVSLAGEPKVDGKKISFTVRLEDGYALESVSGGVNPTADGLSITDTVTENNRYNYTIKAKKGDTVSELYVPVWVEDKDFDWHDALLYFAFTDRFADGDPSNNQPITDASNSGTADARWMGGDFRGLQKKVEEGYFSKLGVNTLWISSVSMNAQGVSWGTGNDAQHSYSAYHSYWPVSTFMTSYNQADFEGARSEGVAIRAIEPHFGSLDDLRALVNACHKKGIRVLVDFAANHVHKDSPIVKKHPEWFNGTASNAWICDSSDGWNKAPETCWFSKDLPDINYNNVEARRHMVDHAIWLIKQTGVDGFRVDAVKHMAVQFIRDLRAATDRLFANTGITFYMVGETFDGDPGKLNKYIGKDLLHAQFDFQLYFQMNNLLRNGGMYSVAGSGMYNKNNPYKSDLMGTFIGNHDVARALSVAAGQNTNKWGNNTEVSDWVPYFRVKQALTILLTNPGVPLIYYGDEYGMEGANDPDNRRMMKFGSELNEQQTGMLDYVRKLGIIRSQHSALTRGSREDILLENDKWCYKLSDGHESVIVGIASSNAGGSCNLGTTYSLVDLLNGGTEAKSTGALSFDKDKFQIYLVK